MANWEHLEILLQGVEVWNAWRKENREIIPDLSEANLRGFGLRTVNLNGVNLTETDLCAADLTRASFNINAVQAFGKPKDVIFLNTILHKTNLSRASLGYSSFIGAHLKETNLTQADLSNADLSEANLDNTDFTSAICFLTKFINLDLSTAKNLHLVLHAASSSIDINTIVKSKGKIPIEFLEGAGVPKHVIENMQYLVDIPAIQYYSCFISYSTKDDEFAHQLNDRMKREGLRVWFAPEEMKGGQKIHEQLYEAIRYHDKLILVLSEASMNSNWVQSEIRRARKHEREDKRRKLFPISLVPFGDIQKWELFEADEGVDLAREIREYYIPDFCQWKDYDKFNTEFEKLLRALKAED